MNTPIILHPSGQDVNLLDTYVVYLKRDRDDDDTVIYKLGKSGGDSRALGQTAWDAARLRYHLKGQFPLVFTFALADVCRLMGVPVPATRQEDPKFDDWLRLRLTAWGNNLHLRGQTADGVEIEQLVGHTEARHQELIDAIKLLTGNAHAPGLQEAKMRGSQLLIQQPLEHALLTHKRCLLQAFGGFGKSFLSLYHAALVYKQVQTGYVLCLTPVKDTIKDFEDGAKNLQYLGHKVAVCSLNKLDAQKFQEFMAECEARRELPFIAATVQDISGTKRVDLEEDDLDELSIDEREALNGAEAEATIRKLEDKYKFLFTEKCAMLIRDEIHLHFAAPRTLLALSVLQPEYTLDMTATLTGREYIEFGYTEEQVVRYSLVDALLSDDPDMKSLPRLAVNSISGLTVPEHLKDVVPAAEGFCSTKAFSVEGRGDDASFKYKSWIVELLAQVFSLSGYDGKLAKSYALVQPNKALTNVFMLVMPRGDRDLGAKAKCDLLVQLGNDTFGGQALFMSTAYLRQKAKASNRSLEAMIKTFQEEAGGRRLILVTHRIMLTGVNIPQLEGIAQFDRIGSQSLFLQAIYRLFRKFPGKPNVRYNVYEPSMSIGDMSSLSVLGAMLKDAKEQGHGTVLRTLHELGLKLGAYDDAGFKALEPETLIAQYDALLQAKQNALFGTLSENIVKRLLEERLKELAAMGFLGDGGGTTADGDKTEITEDNGSEKTKSTVKTKGEAEKIERETVAKQIKIIAAMLSQCWLYAVHGGYEGQLKDALDPVKIMGNRIVERTWGVVNQALVLNALRSDALLAHMVAHLPLRLEKHLELTWSQAVPQVIGTLGPKSPTDGQAAYVLDHPSLIERLFQNIKIAAQTVLIVHPKSGAFALEAKRRWPMARIVCLVEDDTFTPILEAQGFEVKTDVTITSMKFDVIVGNPPYLAGKHLQFLKDGLAALNPGGELVFVHPAEWLVQKRETRKQRTLYAPLRDELKNKHVNVTFIDNPWDNVGLYVPLTVTYISDGTGVSFEDTRTMMYGDQKITPKARVQLESLDDVSQWGSSPKAVASFLAKIAAHQDRWGAHQGVKSGGFYVNMSSITGNGKTTHKYYDGVERTISNMWSLVNSTCLQVTNAPQVAKAQGSKTEGNEKIWWSFETQEEAQRALDFITRSKIIRAVLVVLKIDQHVRSGRLYAELPWLDWKMEWDDAKLAEFFKLTADELQQVDEIVATVTQ